MTRPLLNLSKWHALVKGNEGYWIYQWKLLERTWCVYPLISTSFKINHIKWINNVRIPDMISWNNYYGNLYSSPGCLIMFNSVLSQSRVGGDWIRSSYLTTVFLVTLVSLYDYFRHIYFFVCLPFLGARNWKCVPWTRLSSQGCNSFLFLHEFNPTYCIFMARINSVVITEYTSDNEIWKETNNSNSASPPSPRNESPLLPRYHFSNLASFAWCVPLLVHAH